MPQETRRLLVLKDTFSFLSCQECMGKECVKNYMLFAGWEVRIVKNCDRGLENAARGRRPRVAFSSLRPQFFTIWTDPKPANNLFIFLLR